MVNQMVDLFISLCIIDNDAGRQDKGRPAAFQAEDRGVRLSLPAPKNFAPVVEWQTRRS